MFGRISVLYHGELIGRTSFSPQIQLSVLSHEKKKKKYSFLGRTSVFLSFLKHTLSK